MHWNSFSDFIAMGGYATYVWGSFGVAALLMALEPIILVQRRRGLLQRLKRQIRAERSDRTEYPRNRSQD